MSNSKDKIVVAKIEGGLGNQLFMYAAAKRLAVKNDATLRLDVASGYAHDIYRRSYCLDLFNINAEVASLRESYMSAWGGKRRYLARKINRWLPYSSRYYITEEKPFDQRLLDFEITTRVYLQGYWQDERYFKDIENIIRKEFTFVGAHDQKNLAWKEKIEDSNAVCLHVRRKEYEHALPKAYYERAIRCITKRIEKPHFYCFSDEPKWIVDNLTIDAAYDVLTHNREGKEHEDFWLMTHCKHYIIANSSFSWWGAWLNPNPDKIVLAPSKWGYTTAIPISWQTISY